MAPVAVIVSFRLGGTDGVSVEAEKWEWALGRLGFEVRRVAGVFSGDSRPDDRLLPALAVTADELRPDSSEVLAATAGAALLVVDNICSLPLAVEASRAVAAAATRHAGRVLFRHHDLAWQRPHLTAYETEFPPRPRGALHTTINHRSRRELEARGYTGVATIHNHFDLDTPPPDRAAARRAFGFTADELVLFQPSRAIERKNVPGGVRYAGRLQELMPDRRVVYWLAGPAEDGYDAMLDLVLARSPVPVRVGRAHSMPEAYAACDAVLLPSTWEGFGNPTVESIAARRPIAVGSYPVLGELTACGLRFFPLDAPEALAGFLRAADGVQQQHHDVNLRRARISFSLADLPGLIDKTFAAHGWTAW